MAAPTTATRQSASIISVLRAHPRFRRLWLGALVSTLGDTLSWLALTWYVLERSGRGDLVGLLLLCFALPAVAAGPLWGRMLDQFQPRTIMLFDNVARAAVVGFVPLLAAFGALELWMVFVAALVAGTLAPVTQIGVRLLIPALLDDRELEQGNAAYGLTMQLPTVFGPALAGALVARWGAPQALLLDACSFLWMAWTLLGMVNLPRDRDRTAYEPRSARVGHWPPTVLAILGLTGLFYFAYGPLEVALPIFAQNRLDTNAFGYGTLWSALGVGTLLGTLLVGILSHLGRTKLVLVVIMALWGAAMIALALTASMVFALVAMFVGGVIWGPYTALETTLLQRSVDAREHGRLFGLRAMLLGPAAPLGTALGGVLLLGIDARTVIVVSGVGCVFGAALAWQWMRRDAQRLPPIVS